MFSSRLPGQAVLLAACVFSLTSLVASHSTLADDPTAAGQNKPAADGDDVVLVSSPEGLIAGQRPGVVKPGAPPSPEALLALAQRDPEQFMRYCLDRYRAEIRDYTCVFEKCERIGGKLRKVEQIEVRYREQPTSVYMIWKKNADKARRVLFIDTPEFVNGKGEKIAHIEPAGAIARLFVSDVEIPIHGEQARRSSRRPIDQFGFRRALEKLLSDNARAAERGELEFHYSGNGEIDGRPTWVFERILPYRGPNGPYPNARMVMHIDREWLLPTAVYTFADKEGKQLLGSYIYTQVRLNPRLPDEAFKF